MKQDKLKQIKQKALEEHIPIIMDDTLQEIEKRMIKNKPSKILEIGTAVGYSAICFSEFLSANGKIDTIERDEERYLEAIKNIKNFGLENRITLIFNDAFNVQIDKKFDLIFFDAAKAQNIHFFTYFEKNLEKHGTIITDNIFFHGYTYMDPEKIESRNVRGIARKIRDYVSFLEENDSYETVIKKIGDGIAVTRRK